jgi:hypothetical protein
MTTTINAERILNSLIVGAYENPYGPEFYQIGVYCESRAILDLFVEGLYHMGFDEWTRDVADHISERIDKHPIDWTPLRIQAHMAFNYQIFPGKEFELMYWWHPYTPVKNHPFHYVRGIEQVCMTYKVKDTWIEEQRLWEQFGLRPVYRFTSWDHENPQVKGRARYRDIMYDTYADLGYNLRFSAKLPWAKYFVVPRGSGVELNPHYWGHDISDSTLIDGKWYRHGWEPKDGSHS